MTTTATTTMRAVTWDRYGAPGDVLSVGEIPVPQPTATDVLVRVRAAAANPYDWHFYRGDPYLVRLTTGLTRPKQRLGLGADFAGIVEAVGADVTAFAPGDRVYGEARLGAFAQYVAVPETAVTRMPRNLSFEEAASVPMGALTAMAALESGGFAAGQSVIVNGASGGIGIFAVQLAKALGASHVTGICSTRNVDKVRALGADEVIDYTRADYTEVGPVFDLFIETQYSKPFRKSRRVLTRQGTFATAGGGGGKMLGPGGPMLRSLIVGGLAPQRVAVVMAKADMAMLARVTDLIEAGEVRPLIDATYSLDQIVDAMTHLETGHVSGKVVITI